MTDEETAGEKIERLRSRLSYEQRTFCEEFIRTQDAKVAYELAYGTASATRGFALLERWYIGDYVTALLEGSNVQDLLVTKAEVMATLADRMRNAGEDKDRIRAAEIVGKFLGLSTTKKVEVTGKDGGPIKSEAGLNEAQIKQLRADFLGVDADALTGDNDDS